MLVRELFPQVGVVTPDLDEASWLLGQAIEHPEQLRSKRRRIPVIWAQRPFCSKAVICLEQTAGTQVTDLCAIAQNRGQWRNANLRQPRIASKTRMAPVCTLSSAMACRHLALGASLPDAVAQARAYIVQAIASGQPVQTGQGHGTLNRNFAPRAMVVLDE